MKTYYKYIVLICLALSSFSCKKGFLEESSQDMVRPTTTEALNQLMTGEAYTLSGITHDYSELLSDDIQANYDANTIVVAALNKFSPVFTWEKNMIDRLLEVNASSPNIWYNYYIHIKGCNVVLDYVDKVSGSQAEKDNIRGQALALRSYYYLMLVNFFGKPYTGTAVNPETDLGVPLILTAEVSDAPISRATVKQVYSQLESDLLTAIPLLDANGAGNSIYKFNATAARLLLSRIYLYMGNWDGSINYTNQVIAKKPGLKNYNEITGTAYPINGALVSPEVIWGFGSLTEVSSLPFGNQQVAKASFTASDDLLNSFEPNDIRLTYNFANSVYVTSTLNAYKSKSGKFATSGNVNSKAFRTAEAYLNRAEANIQKAIQGNAGAINSALADLNLLRSNRIKTANYAPITISDPQALYTFYKAERRRELSLEDHRWFDLRRWGMPSIQHTIQVTAGAPTTVTLQQNDSRYTLGIPSEALNRNTNLVQNP
ncbi:RagB/SusD family nutrient uptake outer membrane protein [Pedobacter sp. MC2016-14]|uniref:RagB/SusD family nutrient uptake outer membrane protein n=1 Tax=Pedobacter sp. MC2016-14 TaxID=2897327 RepID=UPI001E5F95DA|nr:RagB/SusD family nutrient uptake outer membrane protein [Pedobacter sp. MC2016-14]MCD0488606.1 RagB/SusD family nutrient uptake outer membrane protein [Pedobacter sp. MC2016-14]